MASIQGVVFDYGLVLSGPPDPASWTRLKSLLSADEDSFYAAYWRPRHDYDRGALNGDTYWSTVASELGSSPDADTFVALRQADVELWTKPNHEMIAWAAALQRQGVRTAILSNLGDAMESGLRERFAWLEGFDHITFSHRLGTAKPDPAIYHHAAQGIGLPIGEILFVDDREDNIAAAKQLGMQAIQYTDHARFIEEFTAMEADLPLPAALP